MILGDDAGLLADAPCDAYGCIDYTKSKIYIDPEISKDFQKETLLHEVLHGILDDAHIDKIIKNEELLEDFVSALAPRLIQVLNDNKNLIDYLTK